MTPDVVVVGSFVQDLTFRCAEFPEAGETVLGEFAGGPGGKGSNQAVAARRAGVRTRFIGGVGRDSFATGARQFQRAEHIDSICVAKPGYRTATAVVTVDGAGRNRIVVAIGASAHLSPSDVPARLLRGAKVVVCQHEASLAVNRHVFRAGRRLGATTILNPAPMRDDFDPAILQLVDVLIPNESEFVALLARYRSATPQAAAGLPPPDGDLLRSLGPDELQQLCRIFGVPTVIVTLGDRGCFVSLPDRCEHLPAHAVTPVDSTGAGDAFVGAFSAGLVKFQADVLTAARFANAAAAISVTRQGTSESMPRAAEITRLLKTPAPKRPPRR